MKKHILIAAILGTVFFSGCCHPQAKMSVTSNAIENGKFAKKFGKHGSEFKNGMPTFSIPFKVTNAPKNTVSYAIVLEDKDAVPFCGFTWIHWIAANIENPVMQENASILNAKDFVQGVNSWVSSIGGSMKKEDASCYGGMSPPDKTHKYELYVYALDKKLDLENGFTFNQLHWAMQGHILSTAVLTGTYDN